MEHQGYESTTGLYFERSGDQGAPPVVFIHGGGASGACWYWALDGRPGWATLLAERGFQVWVTDWPGHGRSGGRDGIETTYDDLVMGYQRLLEEHVGRECVLVGHSMAGGIMWKLAQISRGNVRGVVGLATAGPGNNPPRSEVLSDDGRTVVARFLETGAIFEIDRLRLFFYGDEYYRHQGIATSSHFRPEWLADLKASIVGLSPALVMQRMGISKGLPTIDAANALAGLPVRLIFGTEDPAHTTEIEESTRDVLIAFGADARVMPLSNFGIDGNGHFLFLEENSDDVFRVFLQALEEVN